MKRTTSLKIQPIFGSPMRIIWMIFISTIIFSTPLSLKNTPFYKPNTISIVVFYTSWCPPCKKSLVLLDEIKKEHPQLSINRSCIDDTESQKRALSFGVSESVPLILIAGSDGTVVKRFESLPDKTILNALIQRLEEGRLENGTLPIEQRVDTWKMDRKGM